MSGDWTLLGLSGWRIIGASVCCGVGTGLLGLSAPQGMGVWLLLIAARVMLRS